MARERLAEAGMLDRVRLVAGDFYEDELPGGHDLALLSAIIHQNSPEENVELFRKVLPRPSSREAGSSSAITSWDPTAPNPRTGRSSPSTCS